SAITCLTAQNPVGVRGIQPCRPDMVRAQIKAVFEELPPAAVKTGMLYSSAIQRVVTDWFTTGQRPPLVVDPVMIASSGAALVKNAARSIHLERLLHLALLVTPNLDETGALLD